MLIIKRWRSDFVLSPFISAFDFFNYWFSFIYNPYGRRYSKSRTRPSKILKKGTYHPEIRYSCLDWPERLRQSQMTLRMWSNWSEASLKARSCILRILRFFFGLTLKKVIQRSRVMKANQISQKRKQKRWLTNDGQSVLNIP